MLSFKSPEISDISWARDMLLTSGGNSCENCFGNLFMWADVYKNQIGRFENFFITKNSYKTQNIYSCPIGNGDFKKALNAIINDSKQDNKPFKLYGVTAQQIEMLNEAMPGSFDFIVNEAAWDYIYKTANLATLSGKKYHQKRNHISNFEKNNPDWQYHDLTKADIEKCLAMHREWIEENQGADSKSYQHEYSAAKIALEYFDELELRGGFITANSKLVAYTFGEKINTSMFCTHVEKAFSSIQGAYAIINREFAKRISDFEFVNREEDLGIDGLRRAKLSYRPVERLEKSVAVFKAE